MMATFYNSATLSYNGNVTNSNLISGELLEALSATKTAVSGRYAADDDVTYVVSILNTSTTDYTNLTLTDDLGAYTFGSGTVVPLSYVADSVLYYSNGVLQAAPTVAAGPPLTISGVSVPAGGNAIIVYEAAATRFAPLDANSSITNTVTVSGRGVTTPVSAEETINIEVEPMLTISKSLSPSTVTENSQITYTFTIQNTGNVPATAADNVVLTDLFDPILSSLSVTFNGTPWTTPANYTYNAATGLFTTVAGQITVPAATYTQDPSTGAWAVTPGVSTLIVTGTI